MVLKQKNYRNFTVGELLDQGLKVEISLHEKSLSEDDAKEITGKFEGTKQSAFPLGEDMLVVNGWKGRFRVAVYIKNKTKGRR